MSRHGLRFCLRGCARALMIFAVLCVGHTPQAGVADDAKVLPLALWQNPPHEARPVTRWWWPGGAVEPAVAKRQLQQISDAGFGAVEVQPLLLGLGDDDLRADTRLRSVGEPTFRETVRLAAAAAADAGLDFDFTLGSGWPGGLPTEKHNAERQLLMGTIDLVGPIHFEGPLPDPPDQSYRWAVELVLDVLGPPDPDVRLVALLAGRLGPPRDRVPTLTDVRELTDAETPEGFAWDVPEGKWRIFALYENATGHFVMGGAYPGAEADALVVDHLSRRGADALLTGYAEPALAPLPSDQVREVFVDSFELMGELPFSAELLDAFAETVGYPLTPHLPLLFRKGGESKYGEMVDFLGRNGGPVYLTADPERAERIREDYVAVRAMLFEQRFIGRFVDWAHDHGYTFRLQAHGGYSNYLDTYARADVPESEALFGGGSYDFLKLAASAAHVAGRRWVSSESFITLRLFGTRLSEEEMRLLAGRAYSAGINRLAFHGVPYPYKRADGKMWYPFSGGFGRILAGPLPMSSHIDAEFLAELPAFNRFLTRLSTAMSHGEPVADVAWLRSDPIYPDTASLQIGRIKPLAGESQTTKTLRARGLVHDRVSRRMLTAAKPVPDGFTIGSQHYRALLLDPLEIADPELVENIVAIAKAGVPVVALGALPRRAPGLRDAENRDQRVRAGVERLSKYVVRVSHADRLEKTLSEKVTGSLVVPATGTRLSISVAQRRSRAGNILLLFNESWSAATAELRFISDGEALTLWDPWSGARRILREDVAANEVVRIELDAAETLILTLRDAR